MNRVEVKLAEAMRAARRAAGHEEARPLAWRVLATGAYLGAAALLGGPGIAVRVRLGLLGLQSLRAGERDLAYDLLFQPMDSVRYFEFEFARNAISKIGSRSRRYLDLSSPRLFPLTTLLRFPELHGTLSNPDEQDLAATRRHASSLGLHGVRFLRCGAEEIEGAFDVITSLSVFEHIPDDRAAVEAIWRHVEPGGRLVVSVPCAREAFEEYVDFDPYGLGAPEAHGFYFGQRFYDEELLATTFAACGRPSATAVFGEKRAGVFVQDRLAKASGRWNAAREPLAMATAWRRFDRIDDLPGLGVVGLVFDKPR